MANALEAEKNHFARWCDACIVAAAMRVLPRALLLFAGLHFLLLVAAPNVAHAQPAQPVQPVPYPNAPPPVPYGRPAPPAAPQPLAPVGQDVIRMKNGGILRGTIIDAIPDAQARIQLATGEIATVPWGEIAGIEHAGQTPRPPPPQPPPPSTYPSGPQPSPPPPPRPPRSSALVWVHIEGSDAARLDIDRNSDGNWQTACRAPCDVALPVSADYRIAGGMIKQSGIFQLHGQQGQHVVITVNGGSTAWLVLGIVIVPIAGLVTVIAALVGLVGSVAASADATGCLQGNCAQVAANDRNTATAGWVTALIGAAVTVGGIIMIANNTKTTVAVDVAAGPPADAWVHTPVWHETAQERQMPKVIGVPILSGHF